MTSQGLSNSSILRIHGAPQSAAGAGGGDSLAGVKGAGPLTSPCFCNRGRTRPSTAQAGGAGQAQLSPTAPVSSELTSPVFVAEVGEPPDVAQPDNLPSHGQHKLHLVAPLVSLQGAILRRLFHTWTHWFGLSIAGGARDLAIHSP